MDELTYLEDQARRYAAFSLDSMDRLGARATTMLTLTLGGAGSAGAYALGQIGKPDAVWVLAALGALSLWWFGLAAIIALGAMPARTVRPPANDAHALLRHLRGPLADYAAQTSQASGQAIDALTQLREGELANLSATAADYRAQNAKVARVMDWVYRCAAASPAPALLALGGVKVFGLA